MHVLSLFVFAALSALPGAFAQVKASEISSIDFAAMIGGPLNAVVNAQTQAAMTTVNFVQNVGFHTENRTAITVDFGYFGQSDNGSLVEKQVTVPFLAMLPIPNLEVEECTIEFNAKISSVSQAESESSRAASGASSYANRLSSGAVDMKASFSSQTQAKNSNEEKREFSMHIVVKAKQAQMPEGLKRVMDILADSILNGEKEPAT